MRSSPTGLKSTKGIKQRQLFLNCQISYFFSRLFLIFNKFTFLLEIKKEIVTDKHNLENLQIAKHKSGQKKK